MEQNVETTDTQEAPRFAIGYVVGLLDTGEPAFQLIGHEDGLNSINLRGLHSFASEKVVRLTNDDASWLRNSIQGLNVGVAALLKAEAQAPPVETKGKADQT